MGVEMVAVQAGKVEGEELRVEAGAEFMRASPTRSPQSMGLIAAATC
jgi:hypothetical protein